jgi:hypothetical protein
MLIPGKAIIQFPSSQQAARRGIIRPSRNRDAFYQHPVFKGLKQALKALTTVSF